MRPKARAFVQALYKNVPVLDSGARGSTTTFAQRSVGDVLLAWENEAYLTLKEFGQDKFEIVNPAISILAEPPVSMVDKVVDKHGTRKVAEEYLKHLYSPEAQEIAGRNFYRPRSAEALAKYRKELREDKAVHHRRAIRRMGQSQKTHFADGGVFDQIYKP